ncbi:hypothetical protein [Singulisphaera sp. PoT]|uniref:hypothetical protein n=1 Tax=Singulisphaera sp. PoT TaxID=3411797 RepID=UPI003BF5C399
MATTRRMMVFGALVAGLILCDLSTRDARAQARSRSYVPNSYEDFPNNQGSLFYQYRGPGSTRRPRATAPQTYYYPNTVTAPRQYAPPAQSYYYYPQAGGQPYYYAPQVQGGYAPQAPVYYYYPSGVR